MRAGKLNFARSKRACLSPDSRESSRLQEQHLAVLPQFVRERGRRSARLASSVPGHDPHDRGAARPAELLLYVSFTDWSSLLSISSVRTYIGTYESNCCAVACMIRRIPAARRTWDSIGDYTTTLVGSDVIVWSMESGTIQCGFNLSRDAIASNCNFFFFRFPSLAQTTRPSPMKIWFARRRARGKARESNASTLFRNIWCIGVASFGAESVLIS